MCYLVFNWKGYTMKRNKEVGLHSVGEVFDTETLVLYPMFKDGTADYDYPSCLEDAENEWYRQLDKDDLLIVHIAVIHRMKVENSLSKLLTKKKGESAI